MFRNLITNQESQMAMKGFQKLMRYHLGDNIMWRGLLEKGHNITIILLCGR